MSIYTEDLDERGPGNRLTEIFQIIASYIGRAAKATSTPVNAVVATGTVVFSGTPIANETLTINGNVYTFKASRAVAGEITISANNTTQGDNLVTAITADATLYTAVNASGTVTISAATKGAAGNAITLAEAATGTAVSGATLTGGVNGTVAQAGDFAFDSTYLYCAIAANTVSGTNWRRISLGSAF